MLFLFDGELGKLSDKPIGLFASPPSWQNLFDQHRKEILQSRLVMVDGKVQIQVEVIHIVVKRCFNLTGLLEEEILNNSMHS